VAPFNLKGAIAAAAKRFLERRQILPVKTAPQHQMPSTTQVQFDRAPSPSGTDSTSDLPAGRG
jgi:hypothetical protein